MNAFYDKDAAENKALSEVNNAGEATEAAPTTEPGVDVVAMARSRKSITAAKKEESGRTYWRSLDELAETEGFQSWLHREFPQGASELQATEGSTRRDFLKLMAASFGLAGFAVAGAGCRRPEMTIVPYAKQPENTIPGRPKFFATSMPGNAENIPLIVETHGHRPTKVEGNAFFKPYGGATTTFSQASVLDVYDPDRAQGHYKMSSGGSVKSSVTAAAARDWLDEIHWRYQADGGEGLHILLDGSTSPTRARLLETLQQNLPGAKLYTHGAVELTASETALADIFGKPVRAKLNLENAKRILSLDADFMGDVPGTIANAKGYANARRVKNPDDAYKMNRLYAAESAFTLTGSMADHRLRLPSSYQAAFAAALLREAYVQTKQSVPQHIKDTALQLKGDQKKWVRECIKDLLAHKGKSLVIAGEHLPKGAHAIAAKLNELVGAVGETLTYVELPASIAAQQTYGTLSNLKAAVEAGEARTLVIMGGNPAYNAPADINWPAVQQAVPEVLRFGTHVDETSALATAHFAQAHYLEAWGDGRTFNGALVPVQPMIAPLFEAISEAEFLAHLSGSQQKDAYALVSETFAQISGDSSPRAYERFLHDGYLPGSEFKPANVDVKSGVLEASVKALASKAATPQALSKDALEIRLLPDYALFDGRYANNGWLQELPDPMSKICWENAIHVGPRLAKELGYDPKQRTLMQVAAVKANEHTKGRQMSPIVELTIDGTTIKGPLNIQPGLADYTVVVHHGYGREVVGRVGQGSGFSVAPLINSASPAVRVGATLALTEEFVEMPNVQEHWSMEGRAIIREGNAETFAKTPDFAQHMGSESHSPPIYGKSDLPLHERVKETPRGTSAYEHPNFTAKQQWGMSIDLNTCIGCNQCVIACQSENNIPIVGREEVIGGREMHWIRLDRYYSSGDNLANAEEIPEDPQVSMQPMTCQHCENAPCEQVCPVNATVHDEQGLNVMAYNRCVGTRYCSNNCPYKVRRFNFFDYNKHKPGEHKLGPFAENVHKTQAGELAAMQRNPDVTVRMRGVMEKCTYCQQRIEDAKITQKVIAGASNNTSVPDGVIKTACQQACPTDAIVFGDVADPETEVSKLKNLPHDYAVLGYLNTRPRTTYLAKLRNPNAAMPDFTKKPKATLEYKQKADKGGISGHGAKHGEDHLKTGSKHTVDGEAAAAAQHSKGDTSYHGAHHS